MPRPGLLRLGVVTGLIATAVVFAPATAQSALLDANCPGPPNASIGGSGDQRSAQTFTALHTGTVVRAQVEIDNLVSGGNFQLQILGTNASGVPVDGILGLATIPNASVPTGPTTLAGTFSSPASVVAGEQYALVATRPGGATFNIRDRGGNTCPGREFFSSSQTGTFNPGDSAFDFVFQVFVNPPNDFTVGKLKRKKLTLKVSGAGEVEVEQASGGDSRALVAKQRKLLKTSKATAAAAGDVTVKLRPTKAGNAKLRDKGRLKVNAAITFTPNGGDPKTVTQKLKIKG